ncbi:hypothetical protein M2401_004443 [Pseudomonas sp. JUb42]|jgi:hypothetical protein|uniref:hypothetical protein n=1 Tax=Pseudomonas sp. JUb42 TaxID=2940611 RepID=UPI002169B026|nr:hypothetical protein [Pseudomonas sp. JUb42]MCS3470686.1 hypothetical protein [Pseudomonas sp. JUb42]
MKTKVSRWQRFHHWIVNKNKPTAVAVFILGALSVDLAGAAPGGLIKFRGHITQASCEVRTASLTNNNERVLRVSPGINILVNTVDNACSHSEAPFTLAYKPLPVSAGNAAAQMKSGVVTMTYE